MSVHGEDARRNVIDEPVDAVDQPLASHRTAADNEDVMSSDALEVEQLADLVRRERAGDVLLVGEY